MTLRRAWLFSPIASIACNRERERSPESLLPANLEGWHRTALRSVPPAKPEIRRAFEAAYQTTGDTPENVTIDLYETKAPGTAFEMTQHFKAAPGTVFFDKGNYFAIVKWNRAGRQSLQQLVRDMQRNLETH